MEKKEAGFGRWIKDHALLLVVILALIVAFFATINITPKFTVVKTSDPMDDYPVYEVKVENKFPLRSVEANVDGAKVNAAETSDRVFTVTPIENGRLTVKTTLKNGRSAIETLDVTDIDFDEPKLVSQEFGEGEIRIEISDGDGFGVNWDSISAITVSGDEVKPSKIDKEKGYVWFNYPDEDINIYVEDMKQNVLQMVLTVS